MEYGRFYAWPILDTIKAERANVIVGKRSAYFMRLAVFLMFFFGLIIGFILGTMFDLSIKPYFKNKIRLLIDNIKYL